MQIRLIPVDGGRPIRVERELSVVGRRRWVCDICLEDENVSRVHSLLVIADGQLFVHDLGSRNGTRINGERVSEQAVFSGDEIQFASTRFRVNVSYDGNSSQDLGKTAPRPVGKTKPLPPDSIDFDAPIGISSQSDSSQVSDG